MFAVAIILALNGIQDADGTLAGLVVRLRLTASARFIGPTGLHLKRREGYGEKVIHNTNHHGSLRNGIRVDTNERNTYGYKSPSHLHGRSVLCAQRNGPGKREWLSHV